MTDTAIQVDTNIPAGNAVIEQIANDTIHFRPDLRDTQDHWFYWHIRVRHAGGRRLQCHLTSPHCLTAEGPAVSLDGGRQWAYLGPQSIIDDQAQTFIYDVPHDADDIRLSMAMPYTQENLDRFLAPFAAHPNLRRSVLCRSRQGRAVEKIEIRRPDTHPHDHLILTARHHACEMMASYALQGFLELLLTDNEVGQWFAENVAVTVIPFVDKDGAENGDQGKNRRPHDHNRDYLPPHVYPETAAIVQLVESLPGHLRLNAIDLHCPWIRGDYNEFVYLVGLPDAARWQQQQAFGHCFAQQTANPIPYDVNHNLPYGQGWNNKTNFKDYLSSSGFMAHRANIHLATSIEIPYATADGVQVNQHTAQTLGHTLAAATKQYLQTPD